MKSQVFWDVMLCHWVISSQHQESFTKKCTFINLKNTLKFTLK